MKTNNIKESIKEYFFINPTAKLRVRQIERAVKVHLPSVIRYTKELEHEEILKKIDIAGVRMYTADRSSKRFLLQKTFFNIQHLQDSGLIDFLIKELSNPTIVIFGSYSKGEDTEDSDIDVYIETKSKKTLDLTEFEKKLKRKIQIFVYKKVKEVKNNELANNIVNGITLNGFLEVF